MKIALRKCLLLFVGILFLLLETSCHHRAQVRPAELGPPTHLVPSAGYLTNFDVEIFETTSLDSVVNLAWAETIELGFIPFETRGTLESTPVAGLVRYFTFQEQMPRREVHHVVFVTVREWNEEFEDRFIQTFCLMPYTTPTSLGTPVFHFVGNEPSFSVNYVFGNQWWGMLESAMLVALNLDEITPSEMISRSVTRLRDFGVTAEGENGIPHLDQLLAALPRDEDEESTYVPAGTLNAIGFAFGALLQEQIGGLEWTDDPATMSISYALHVSDFEDTFLRPIDYVYEAYSANSSQALADYAELANIRISALREE